MNRLKWNERKLKDYQNLQVRRVIYNAFENVPFYRRIFQEKGIHPSDIRGINDLHKIPIFKKSDLKKLPPQDLISIKKNLSSLKKITTGGSTGKPFSVYLDSNEDAWRKAIYLRANIACGQKARDKWFTIIDAQYASGTSKLQELFGFYIRNIVPITLDRDTRLKIIQNQKPDILDGFPSALFLLAKDCEQKGGASIAPRLIFGSGELVDKHKISFLQKIFDAPYLDQFGCTEIDRAAWQCVKQGGYHMDVDSVIMQFVDEEGNEVSAGEDGEIVYTSLFNYSFPILRYNIEDVGVSINEKCSCGNNLPLMKLMMGRQNSYLVFTGNQIVSPIDFIEVLGAFKLEREIEQYKVIQEKIDYLRIIIQKTNPNIDERKIRETLTKNLKKFSENPLLREAKFSFDIDFVEEIPRTSRGKLNVISSNVPISFAM
jgi:phenylacetate-CoA ligase